MTWLYLIGLLVSLSGLAVLDWRYKLAFWHDVKRSSYTIISAIIIFIAWDLLGIGLGIFYHGNSNFTLPIRLLPQFPIEEIFFLALLCYVVLVIYRAMSR